MSKPIIERVLNNVLNNIVKNIFNGVIITITASFILFFIPKSIFTLGIFILIAILSVIYLFFLRNRGNELLMEPDALIKNIENNMQEENVKDTVNEFVSRMNRFFVKNSSDASLDELENQWSYFNENKITLDIFIKRIYLFLENEESSGSESIRILKKIYTDFTGNINKIKANIDKNPYYPDVGDDKVKKDIMKYEHDSDYWEKSNDWVNQKMKKYIDGIREKRKNQGYNSLRILDIGTGTGRVVECLCQEGDYVCLIDSDARRLNIAENNIRDIIKDESKVKCINSRFEIFEDSNECTKVGLRNNFDIIICSHVIQHNSTDIANCFYKIIHNLLLSDGILFLLFPISRSNKEEFVVEGLEYDIVKFKKSDFIKSKKAGNIGNLDIHFRNKVDFETFGTHLSSYKDNSGYWKVTKEQSGELLYEITQNKSKALAYKRIYNRGLVCSIDTKFAEDFNKKDNSISIIQLINNNLDKYNPNSERISEKAIITSNILSDFWLIHNSEKGIKILIARERDQYIAKEVSSVIVAYGVYYNELEKGQIPTAFINCIPDYNNLKILKRKNNFIWELVNKSGEKVVSIYKTQSFYSLILDSENGIELEADQEQLLIKQIPAIIKEAYFKDTELLSDIIIDSEVPDGWIIKENDDSGYFARYDSDWIRVFQTEPFFKDLSEFPDILKPLINDKLWKPENTDKDAILPSYTVVRIKGASDKKYFAYRDKKYNDISRRTFNNLCKQQMKGLGIVPTHRFIIKSLKRDLRREGLGLKQWTIFHSLTSKQSMLDKMGLRDKYLNLFIIKRIRKIHQKYNIQDCLFVVKKK